MKIDIITLFPFMFEKPFEESIIGRAKKNSLVEINTWNLRDFTTDKYRTVDDYPFGGGTGMVLKPEPFFKAVKYISETDFAFSSEQKRIILMSPQGQPFNQEKALELSKYNRLILLCGHYEGFDERIREFLADEEISIGDYVLTGGELPAMVVVDAVVRLLPGVLGSNESIMEDSFSNSLLEYPQYTRPRIFEGHAVPEVLLSGNHQQISKWRRLQSLLRTLKKRPDLLEQIKLSDEERVFLEQMQMNTINRDDN